ncbi:hypothetical protein BDN72DRAFT_590640 [Pluteus cervinus]|uniref:Uncharacterized protein n=1 Tax=Pluteus cervinus TaxID=181527 RepID=A0ACD3A187_9AGAR|nr:hypothetical protein BDN72DRAFT_590640 [Pluteus cervinus]
MTQSRTQACCTTAPYICAILLLFTNVQLPPSYPPILNTIIPLMDPPSTDGLHQNAVLDFVEKAYNRLPSSSSCLAAFFAALQTVHKLFLSTCLFGLPTTYFYSYQILPLTTSPGAAAPIASASAPWSQMLEKHKHKWQMLNIISLVLLPLNVTILQIESIASWEVTRTTTVLSLWFSCAGLLCGCINLLCLPRMQDLHQRLCINEERTSLKFWNLWIVMALPAALTIWSAISLVVTIILYSFVRSENDNGTARRSVVSIVLALIGFVMLPYVPVLRAAVGNRALQNSGNPAQPSSNTDNN